MKKSIFLTLTLFLGLLLAAQNKYSKPNFITKNQIVVRNDFSSHEPIDFTPINISIPLKNRTIYSESVIFNTIYDLQTSGSLTNRLVLWNDKTMSAVTTFGMQFTNFLDRGTAYNHFNGSSWYDIPISRIESIRSASPSIAKLGINGEIVASHNTEVGCTAIYTRENKGEGSWNEKGTLQNPEGKAVTWPRIASGGTNNNCLHLMGGYQFSENGVTKTQVYYNRSTNGGESWTGYSYPPLVDVEGLYNYLIKPDSYSIATNGPNVAILFCGTWHDLFYIKSSDNGETWQKKLSGNILIPVSIII